MAINVDKVYKVVLAIINKEQRGYLTPDQFNRLGRQAQLDLLEKSFYDYNRALTRRNMQGVNSEYGDIAEKIEEKIEALTTSNWLDFGHADPDKGNVLQNEAWLVSNSDGPFDPIYKILSVSTNGLTGEGRTTQVERVKKSEFLYLNASKLTAPTQSFPAYYVEDSKLTIYPTGIQEATIDYVKLPSDPKWGYTVVNNAYIYDGRTVAEAEVQEDTNYESYMGSTDFELHPSEEVELVYKILEYAGLSIKDPGIYQIANGEEQESIQQEKS